MRCDSGELAELLLSPANLPWIVWISKLIKLQLMTISYNIAQRCAIKLSYLDVVETPQNMSGSIEAVYFSGGVVNPKVISALLWQKQWPVLY